MKCPIQNSLRRLIIQHRGEESGGCKGRCYFGRQFAIEKSWFCVATWTRKVALICLMKHSISSEDVCVCLGEGGGGGVRDPHQKD